MILSVIFSTELDLLLEHTFHVTITFNVRHYRIGFTFTFISQVISLLRDEFQIL